ncbi:hypothetical protein B296_00027362 [Ensete ventricosum]|uniref:Uncharacterized protein n=1 Tax=Ensete ventricosum TaxID=4639 RepID=A0A427A933_ENSVE|nr:hypothetical protein B296_00027362 [Ensete ventricosum]
MPRLAAREQGARLVPARGDEATPRSPLEGEAAPRSPTGRRGSASSPREEMRRRLVSSFPHGKTRSRFVPGRGDARQRPDGKETNRIETGSVLTELSEARILRIGDRVTDRGQIDVGVVPHLPVLVEEPLIPRQLLRILEQLLVLRSHRTARPPPSSLLPSSSPTFTSEEMSSDRCRLGREEKINEIENKKNRGTRGRETRAEICMGLARGRR